MGCGKKKLLVCTKDRCSKGGALSLYDRLTGVVAACGLEDHYKVKKAGCFGLCKHGPIVKVKPDKAVYARISKEDMIKIALRHVKKKKPLKDLALPRKKR